VADGRLIMVPSDAKWRIAPADERGWDIKQQAPANWAKAVVASFRRKISGIIPSNSLTTREEETLVLLTKGYSNKEIAEHLTLSIETVRSHLKNIYTKMHVRSAAESVHPRQTMTNKRVKTGFIGPSIPAQSPQDCAGAEKTTNGSEIFGGRLVSPTSSPPPSCRARWLF
jgi:DNA-binding CsgD family transcriptional regulator